MSDILQTELNKIEISLSNNLNKIYIKEHKRNIVIIKDYYDNILTYSSSSDLMDDIEAPCKSYSSEKSVNGAQSDLSDESKVHDKTEILDGSDIILETHISHVSDLSSKSNISNEASAIGDANIVSNVGTVDAKEVIQSPDAQQVNMDVKEVSIQEQDPEQVIKSTKMFSCELETNSNVEVAETFASEATCVTGNDINSKLASTKNQVDIFNKINQSINNKQNYSSHNFFQCFDENLMINNVLAIKNNNYDANSLSSSKYIFDDQHNDTREDIENFDLNSKDKSDKYRINCNNNKKNLKNQHMNRFAAATLSTLLLMGGTAVNRFMSN